MAAEIIALVCPVCGAPLQKDSSECVYCGSLVAIRADSVRSHPAKLKHSVIQASIESYRATIDRDPSDETAHYGLGLAYFNLGLVNEAADELTQAARLTPENPSIQTQLAIVYAEIARS
ncbi:MAG: tetratricopeptide repeat protein, partial [Thermomicrobiales bacterium]|nr:tetratricopeptide repeat protein [Thermomicrobiales bacterium]